MGSTNGGFQITVFQLLFDKKIYLCFSILVYVHIQILGQGQSPKGHNLNTTYFYNILNLTDNP